MTRNAQEIELRLATTAAALRRLPRCAALTSLDVSTPATHRLLSVYWDTPDLRLHASGLALRLRRTDNGAWVQTLKAQTRVPHTRDEFEGPVAGERPDLRLAERLGWRDANPLEDAVLQPMFRTRVARTLRSVRFGDGTLAEIAIDRGDIAIGDEPSTRAPIREIELELVEGSACRLYELAYRLVRELPPTRLSFPSKAERGYELLAHASPAPRRARTIDVAAKSPPALVAFRASAEGLLHVEGNAECARAGRDPEGVHQMRVGIRRLRVAGAIARAFPERLDAELKWLARLLGETRDLDVFATQTWPDVRKALGDRAAETTDFEAAVAQRRDASQRNLRRALDGRRFQLLMLAAGWAVATQREELAQPSRRHATKRSPRRLLARRAKRTLDDGRAIDRMTERERHRLRIDLRKLRYLAEFFAGLYPQRRARRYLRRIAAVQAELGALNDLAVTGSIVRSIASAGPAEQRRLVGGLWRRHASAQKPMLERRLAASWKKLAAATPFWD
ncbi:MAG TPA: CYTH and CHAD domain-containing protein [Casimicrobiaceae bacterium]